MTEALKDQLAESGVDQRLVDLFARNMEQTEGKSEAELKALIIREGGARVQSIKFRNWIVNWRDIVLGAVPAFVEAVGHALRGGDTIADTIAVVLSALEGFKALVEAAIVELSSDHARVVKALWLDRRDEARVRSDELSAAAVVPGDRLEPILEDLMSLGIIERESGWIIKREKVLLSS